MSPSDTQIIAVPYAWPHDATFSPQTAALLLIDMQRDLCSEGEYMDQQGYDISAIKDLITPLQRLLHAFRAAGLAVYHIRHGA
ncbi:hypothetical protein LTR66_004622 [Elasticomyces elasticus]|nr:hypothetical protein LTR66_004622 [Elasticomyces elasticus]